MDKSAIIVSPADGVELRAFGDVLTVKLGGEQTDGSLMVAFDVTPPGGGPPPHVHRNEDELFIVLSGRVSFYTAGAWNEVLPHSVIYLPSGVPHTYRNVGDTPSTLVIITKPAGFETYFARCAELFASGAPVDMARIVQISAEHGIEFLDAASA